MPAERERHQGSAAGGPLRDVAGHHRVGRDHGEEPLSARAVVRWAQRASNCCGLAGAAASSCPVSRRMVTASLGWRRVGDEDDEVLPPCRRRRQSRRQRIGVTERAVRVGEVAPIAQAVPDVAAPFSDRTQMIVLAGFRGAGRKRIPRRCRSGLDVAAARSRCRDASARRGYAGNDRRNNAAGRGV